MIYLSLLPVIFMFWVNSALKAGLILLWVSISVSMLIYSSLTVYLIILVYISGVLVLMLYFSMLLSNSSYKSNLYWILILGTPSLLLLFDAVTEPFSMSSLFFFSMKLGFMILLSVFVSVLLIISSMFGFSKSVRFV